jgi:hypothetical protein
MIEKLDELGFSATDLGTKNGKTLVRIWTSKGWCYERFETVEQVEAWALRHEP